MTVGLLILSPRSFDRGRVRVGSKLAQEESAVFGEDFVDKPMEWQGRESRPKTKILGYLLKHEVLKFDFYLDKMVIYRQRWASSTKNKPNEFLSSRKNNANLPMSKDYGNNVINTNLNPKNFVHKRFFDQHFFSFSQPYSPSYSSLHALDYDQAVYLLCTPARMHTPPRISGFPHNAHDAMHAKKSACLYSFLMKYNIYSLFSERNAME
jgi:hypothetical protein